MNRNWTLGSRENRIAQQSAKSHNRERYWEGFCLKNEFCKIKIPSPIIHLDDLVFFAKNILNENIILCICPCVFLLKPFSSSFPLIVWQVFLLRTKYLFLIVCNSGNYYRSQTNTGSMTESGSTEMGTGIKIETLEEKY